MNTILVGKDFFGNGIKKGDTVAVDDGQQGKITAVWDNNSVDIHVANAHQGPVIDSFDIDARRVIKIEPWDE